jgi:hypothetical protein
MVRYLLIILYLFICAPLYANDLIAIKDENGKIVSFISKPSLQSLIEASEKYKDIMNAQKEKRLNVTVIAPVEETNKKNEFKTTIKLTWHDNAGKEINYITALMFLNIENANEAGMSEWRLTYREISEIGFPILFIITCILLLL